MKPETVTPIQMYYAAFHAIDNLVDTVRAQVVTGWSIGNYFPFKMGLVQTKRTDDVRYETYELTPTEEGLALFKRCFPGRTKSEKNILVGFIGDPLNPADGPKAQARNKK